MLFQPETSETKAIRIVIVEDFRLARMGLKSILNGQPRFQVIADAEDAESGLQTILSEHPEVVLMDLDLPGLTGIDATRRIKTYDESIGVIIYSSHEDDEEVIAALGAGADGYCVKSPDPQNVINAIQLVSEGAAWLDPSIASIAMSIFRKSAPMEEAALESAMPEAPRLTQRETEVLTLLVEGKSNGDIADALCISSHTAKEHVCNILQKLSVQDRVQAAVKAIKEGWV